MECLECESYKIPMDLLLIADPSEKSVSSYLTGSWCFAASDHEHIIAACIIKPNSSVMAEIYNISVMPQHQGKGIGTELLKFALSKLPSKAIETVELGTGTFGYQLTFYQRLGFRVKSVEQNYFLTHYSDPIFEDGIQHKDRLRLYLHL